MSRGLHVESVGAGPPLVLLHGWAMHSGLWGPLVAHLARRFRVHAVDLPGHGHSAPAPVPTLAAIADQIARRFAAEDAPPTVVGWSLGGLVAMQWAATAPAGVARLVLVCTTPCFVAQDDWPHAMPAATLARFGDELRLAYRLTLQRFLALQLRGSDDGRAVLAALRQALFARGDPVPNALASALSLLAAADLRGVVPAIAAPTLVVAGDRDTLTPPEASAWLASALPAARLAPIPGAGHVPFLSHPAAFNAALEAFLDAR